MVKLRYSRRKTLIILLAVVLALVAVAFATDALIRPSKADYQAASKQADVVAAKYNQLQSQFTTDFLNTDAATAAALAPVQNNVNELRSAADKLGSLKATKYDIGLHDEYRIFRIKLDNGLSATQDLIDGKEFMQAKVYPTCGNSKDFKITSNDIAGQIGPCRNVLDAIGKGDVQSTDVLRNVAEFRANLKSMQQLSDSGNTVGIAYALLATIESKRGTTDFASYLDKQNIPSSFKTLTDTINANAGTK